MRQVEFVPFKLTEDEEDEELHRHISTLQCIDRELVKMEKAGKNILEEIYNLILYID
ncbi:MAG: hypothetical protein IJE52_06500 [Bacteroidales bacterium]|nr:hypothetical protein [Bacteroidales bacterium]